MVRSAETRDDPDVRPVRDVVARDDTALGMLAQADFAAKMCKCEEVERRERPMWVVAHVGQSSSDNVVGVGNAPHCARVVTMCA